MLLGSRETVVNTSMIPMPLGFAPYHGGRASLWPGTMGASRARLDWSPPAYYHQADVEGLGANRGPTGSKATETYAPELATLWGDPDTCPEKFLLWFNHVAWERKMKSGRTLWDELALYYQAGVDGVRSMQHEWDSLQGKIDPERFIHVQSLLKRQEADARDWRDACLLSIFRPFQETVVARRRGSPAARSRLL